MEPSKTLIALSWILRIAAAVILLQTLFFKFTGAKESVYIFSTLGIEPWGRIGSGITEFIAAALLLHPRTVVLGAALSLATILVAITSHLFKLGVTLPAVGDSGQLFGLAVVVLLCSLGTLWIHRSDVIALIPAQNA